MPVPLSQTGYENFPFDQNMYIHKYPQFPIFPYKQNYLLNIVNNACTYIVYRGNNTRITNNEPSYKK
jgi:hypothetical protein